MDIYAELGIRTLINAVGPATRLGGLPLSDEVTEAMRVAGTRNVRMDELQEAAGAEIATLIGAPAAYVTSGAAAALSLATAVCLAGDRPAAVDVLPAVTGPRRRVVIQRAHRDPYDHAVTAVGADLVEIGYPGSTRPDELARELDDRTAMVLWRPGRGGDHLDIAEVSALARPAGVPVLVDAAMDVPPLSRLAALFDGGADLVAISGGKAFRGPHTAGILCGRSDLVAAVALHHQDMDIRHRTWQRSEVTGADPVRGRHGIGRGMKVGREQIVGLLVAVRAFVRDPDAHHRHGRQELADIRALLDADNRCVVRDGYEHHLDVPVIEIDLSPSGHRADEIVRELDRGSPRIHVGEDLAWRDVLTVNPMGLHPGDGAALARRLIEVLDDGTRHGAADPREAGR
ncbi:aminotransferase class V-fold PLP-dependent enzyme [Micromonospora sp. CPCC 206060]|uniref:aminotransferase class V-fold PLP-dependent enzyme n=1 Tax=Micromonospora sp. CPCC 206060 TaxID=3122406 RepID=UPI002FEF86AB